jgi:hypothetical protein
MIRLTEERQTLPYAWVHPDEERWLAELDNDVDASISYDGLIIAHFNEP